ncbi:hypothetical protein ACER0C_010926 [Sarotherodon galilaeus]
MMVVRVEMMGLLDKERRREREREREREKNLPTSRCSTPRANFISHNWLRERERERERERRQRQTRERATERERERGWLVGFSPGSVFSRPTQQAYYLSVHAPGNGFTHTKGGVWMSSRMLSIFPPRHCSQPCSP